MKNFLIGFGTIFFLMINSTFACQPCRDYFNFEFAIRDADLIVIGHRADLEVNADYETETILIGIDKIIKGEEKRETITVNSWDGMCPYGVVIKHKEKYILFLIKTESNDEYDKYEYDAVRRGCAPSQYMIKNEQVEFEESSLSLADFEQKINNMLFSPVFADVSENHPNNKAIKYLKGLNIIEGYEDGTFRPDEKINRAEFLKIAMLVEDEEMLQETKENNINNCFSDIQNQWFTPYVCMAKQKKFIKGYADNSFKPGQNITFVEAAKIISNIFKFGLQEDEEIWYKNFVQQLSEYFLIPPSIEALDKEITRGDMAEIIFRLEQGGILWKKDDFMIYSSNKLISVKDIMQKGHLGGNYYKYQEKTYYDESSIKERYVELKEIEVDVNTIKYLASQKTDYYGMMDYAKDKNNFYRNGKVFSTPKFKPDPIDNSTFENIQGNYYRDKNYIYYLENDLIRLDSANMETFEIKSSNFECALDDENTYFKGEKLSEPTEEIINGVMKDNCFVYYKITESHGQNNGHYVPLKESDPETFEFTGENYAKDKKQVYIKRDSIYICTDRDRDLPCYQDEIVVLEASDLASLEIKPLDLGGGYSRKGDDIFYKDQKIQGADTESFGVKNSNPNCAYDKHQIYLKGKNLPEPEEVFLKTSKDECFVYFFNYFDEGYKSEYVPESDPDTFEHIEASGGVYSKDKNYVYYNDIGGYYTHIDGFILKDADIQSFEYLGQHFAKDKNAVYYLGAIIPEADAETFTVLNIAYAKDKNHVYLRAIDIPARRIEIVQSADPKTFETIGDYYGKDQTSVFRFANVIKEADPNSFIVKSNSYSMDKDHVFYVYWELDYNADIKLIQSVDTETFEIYEEDYIYSRDKNHVYKNGEILEGADPASFKVPEK